MRRRIAPAIGGVSVLVPVASCTAASSWGPNSTCRAPFAVFHFTTPSGPALTIVPRISSPFLKMIRVPPSVAALCAAARRWGNSIEPTSATGRARSPAKEVFIVICPSCISMPATSNPPRFESCTLATAGWSEFGASFPASRMSSGSRRANSFPPKRTVSWLTPSKAPTTRPWPPEERMSFPASSGFPSGSVVPSHGRIRIFETDHSERATVLFPNGCSTIGPAAPTSLLTGRVRSSTLAPFIIRMNLPDRLSRRIR